MTPALDARDPLLGSVLEGYRVLEGLAAGPHGTVYRARPETGGDDVALKVFDPHFTADNEYAARVLEAARTLRELRHPSVAAVFECGTQEDRTFIATELVQGEGLDVLLEREHRLPFAQATRIARDIAVGLAAAHAVGLTHRNLKPSNVLLDADGNARIADFRQGWEPPLGRGLQPEDPIEGPPEYLAPEQVQGHLPDAVTDLYALGVLYYEMLTGKSPFPGATDSEIALKRVEEPPRDIMEAFPGVNTAVRSVVDRLIARDPAERFQSADAAAESLESLLEVESQRSAAERAEQPTDARVPGELIRRLTLGSTAAHFGPGIALLVASGVVAGGADDYLEALASIVKSNTSLGLLGAGVAALLVACFLLRRIVKESGRWKIMAAFIGLAAACAIVSSAGLDPSIRAGRIMALAAPANLALLAALLMWFAVVRSMNLDPDSPPPLYPRIVIVLCAILWYLAWAGKEVVGPAREAFRSIETSMTLIVASLVAIALGMVLLTHPAGSSKGRKFGIGLLGLAAVGIMLWTAAGTRRVLVEPGSWPAAVVDQTVLMILEVPRAGALALVAVGLVAGAVSVLRAGLVRRYAQT